MGVLQDWDRRRYATFVGVIALHTVLLALAWWSSPSLHLPGSQVHSLELLYLPPSAPSRIRPDNFRPHRLGSETLMSPAPPVAGTLHMAPPASGADGAGTGVDWGAEARRALQAFEIRNDKRSNSPAPTGASADDDWWARGRHHAGEQYKTDTGDWIVWINSSCYQVASAASSYALGAVLPQTICPGQDARPRGDLLRQLPAYKAAHPDG